jgi:hypothetical protein
VFQGTLETVTRSYKQPLQRQHRITLEKIVIT